MGALRVALLLALLAAPGTGWAAVQLEPVLSGLSSPLYVAQPRDGTGRLFVVEQPGGIQVLPPDGGGPTVFLDITDRVLSPGASGACSASPSTRASRATAASSSTTRASPTARP